MLPTLGVHRVQNHRRSTRGAHCLTRCDCDLIQRRRSARQLLRRLARVLWHATMRRRRRLPLRRRRPRRRRRQRHLTRVQRPSGPFRRCFTQHQRRPARLDLVATDVIRSIRLEGANAQPLRSRRASRLSRRRRLPRRRHLVLRRHRHDVV